MIQGIDDHGIKGLVNLFGIEPPGLTASLALAKNVATYTMVMTARWTVGVSGWSPSDASPSGSAWGSSSART